MASYLLFPDRKCLLFHTGASGHHLSVLEKLHPGLPLLWHQEFMTCPESGIHSLPELCALCWRFYQNPALRSGALGDCDLLVRACQGHPHLPPGVLGQASENINTAEIYSSVIELTSAKALSGQKSSLVCPFPFPSSSNLLCSLTVDVVIILKKFQKQPVYKNSFPGKDKRTKGRTKSYLALPRTNPWTKLRVLLRWTGLEN